MIASFQNSSKNTLKFSVDYQYDNGRGTWDPGYRVQVPLALNLQICQQNSRACSAVKFLRYKLEKGLRAVYHRMEWTHFLVLNLIDIFLKSESILFDFSNYFVHDPTSTLVNAKVVNPLGPVITTDEKTFLDAQASLSPCPIRPYVCPFVQTSYLSNKFMTTILSPNNLRKKRKLRQNELAIKSRKCSEIHKDL